jgi:hypothetical protein
VNAGPDQSICSGASITISATGANTYIWNNGITNGVAFNPTATATYIVTGTSNGCIGTDQVVVTVNNLPNVNAGVDQSICLGQSVTLVASGATTYTWNQNITNGVAFEPTSTLTYTVVGTNPMGCIATDQVTVTVNNPPIVNAGIDQSICLGQSVTLAASGASTYTWNQNVTNGVAFNPTSTATYSVTGTSNGCTATDQVTVTVNNSSASTVTETATNSYTMNGQTYTQSGTYTQVIGNVFGCDSTITLILTINTSGLDELNQGVHIYPNPSTKFLTIELGIDGHQTYMIYDASGKALLEGELTTATSIVNIEALAPGYYSLKIGELAHPLRIVKE